MISAEKDGVYVRLKIEVEAKGGPSFDPMKALQEMCEQLDQIRDTFKQALTLAKKP